MRRPVVPMPAGVGYAKTAAAHRYCSSRPWHNGMAGVQPVTASIPSVLPPVRSTSPGTGAPRATRTSRPEISPSRLSTSLIVVEVPPATLNHRSVPDRSRARPDVRLRDVVDVGDVADLITGAKDLDVDQQGVPSEAHWIQLS
jgi:hypothetical protein